jgi:hypothetical protein
MKYFSRVHEGLDVGPILAQLDASPHLWDEHRERTDRDDSPMRGTSDIWLRYFPREVLTSKEAYLAPGLLAFYPAWDALPTVHPVAFALMSTFRGVELGGCLISRIPPGGEVKTHTDGAAWTARHFNRKFYIPLRTNPGCRNVTLDEEVVFQAGEVWEFDNLVPHSVHNDGGEERINLIITLRDATA